MLLSREGEGCWTPSVSWTVLITAPCGPRQKRQVGITVCSFVAGGATEAGSGLRLQPLLPSPQQASCLFALEVVLSQVTVKVAGSQDDTLLFNYQLGMAATMLHRETHTHLHTLNTPSFTLKCLMYREIMDLMSDVVHLFWSIFQQHVLTSSNGYNINYLSYLYLSSLLWLCLIIVL